MTPSRLLVNGKSLEVLRWKLSGARRTMVLIHEALGSASSWKSFPALLAESAGCDVVAYSRAGHGDSDGPIEPRSKAYYHRQAEAVLPSLMQEFGISEPILYGHSEGAAIAFLYAAAGNPVKAIIAESPIVSPGTDALRTVEEMNAAEPRKELIEKLGRYHRDAEAVFSSWVESVRLHPAHEFPASSYLPRVKCPVLVLEGALDPFGRIAQRNILDAGIPHLQRVVLQQAGHLPHREQTEAVLENVTRFLTQPFEPAGNALGHHNCG